MKLTVCLVLLCLEGTLTGWGQAPIDPGSPAAGKKPAETSAPFVLLGATLEQEAALRSQIQIMQPKVVPNRVIFVPHWKYLDTARTYRLHLPTGITSKMFTHLPSGTVFIDRDGYGADESLGYWMAHELGHLETNSIRESDAEHAAAKYRCRLKDARRQVVHPGDRGKPIKVKRVREISVASRSNFVHINFAICVTASRCCGNGS